MASAAQPNDDAIKTVAAQIAAMAAEALDQAGVALTLMNTAALTRVLGKALEEVSRERERAVRQGRIERRTTWVDEQGLLNPVDTAGRLGLTLRELETALDLALIAPVEVPAALRATSEHFTPESWRYFLPNIALTETDRARIAHGTLLTRAQAAERLGVSSAAFDRLRAEHCLGAVDRAEHPGSSDLNRYRTDAVDRMNTNNAPSPIKS